MNTEDSSILKSMIGKFGHRLLSGEDISDLLFACEHTSWDTEQAKDVPENLRDRYNKGMKIARSLMERLHLR